MTFTEMLREIVRSTGKSAASISRAVGRSDGFLGNVFSEGKPLRLDTLAAIVKACGYEIVIRGRGREYTLDSSGVGKDVTVSATVGFDKDSWTATPAITDLTIGKSQTSVIEDRGGCRLLIDYRVLSVLDGGVAFGWDDDLPVTDNNGDR